MVEVFVTKAFIGIKLIITVLVYLFKILITPFIFLTNLVNDNSHQMDYNEQITNMVDFKFYISKSWHTIISSLISIKAAIILLIIQFLAFTLPLKEFFLSVIALVVFDTLSALYVLYKEQGSFALFYEKWTSKRAMDTVKKAVWYCLLGLMLYIVGSGIGEAELMKKVALGLVGYIEGKSFIENVDKILGTNIWELLYSFVKDKFLPKSQS